MVQNLHSNLVIAPELGDMRRRLKNLETKDGQLLFVSLYNSWCHNAVATFSLCLLAQAYEHASNLLQSLYLNFSRTRLIVAGTWRSRSNFSFKWTSWFRFWNLLYSLVYQSMVESLTIRSEIATSRAGKVPLFVQMSLWIAHASPSIIRIRNTAQST
jgi:hypothetical protein